MASKFGTDRLSYMTLCKFLMLYFACQFLNSFSDSLVYRVLVPWIVFGKFCDSFLFSCFWKLQIWKIPQIESKLESLKKMHPVRLTEYIRHNTVFLLHHILKTGVMIFLVQQQTKLKVISSKKLHQRLKWKSWTNTQRAALQKGEESHQG